MSQSSSHVMIAIYIFLIIEIFNYIKLTFTANLTKLNISLLPKNCIFLQQSLVTLRASAFNIYKMNSPNRPSTSLNIDVDYSGTSIQTNPAIADIQTFLLGDSNTINKLLSLTDLLSSRQNLNFYIDDALRPPGLTSNNLNTHKTTNMGFGWINIDRTDNNPLYTFYGSTILTPSSTKAESFTILTAVLACPYNSDVSIYTDSMNCINTFRRVNDCLTSIRQVLKIHQIWRVIKHLVNKKSINLSFTKSKRTQVILIMTLLMRKLLKV